MAGQLLQCSRQSDRRMRVGDFQIKMLEKLKLTCLKDWLVSRSYPGSRRVQRDTKLKTHAKISTSSRKKVSARASGTTKQTTSLKWKALCGGGGGGAAVIIHWPSHQGLMKSILKALAPSVEQKELLKPSLLALWILKEVTIVILYVLLIASTFFLTWKTRTWKMSVVTDPTGVNTNKSHFWVMTNDKLK